MNSKTIAAQQWTEAEGALRAKYQDLGLYVRKQVYERPGGVTLVVGGWAFLDGEPAMIPTDLDILVVSTAQPSGAMETMGRDPAAVLSLLAPYATRASDPVDHWAVRVPEGEKLALLDRIRALPEHAPGSPVVAASPALQSSAPPYASAQQVSPQYAAPVPMTVREQGGSNLPVWIAVGLGVAALGVLGLTCVGFGAFAFLRGNAAPPPAATGPVYPPSYPPPSYPYPPPSYPPPSYPPPSSAPDDPTAGERYTLPLPVSAPSRGPISAPLVIQIFSDFQCPFCSRVEPTLARISETYPSQVRFVWRNYPLAFHVNAMPAAEAASEVFAQVGDAGFWPYHDMLFENQRELGIESLITMGSRVPGVDVGRLASALSDHRHRPAVEADMAAVDAAGMSIGTPSFLIGDELLSGAQPFEAFQAVIDAHLAGRR